MPGGAYTYRHVSELVYELTGKALHQVGCYEKLNGSIDEDSFGEPNFYTLLLKEAVYTYKFYIPVNVF